MERSLTAKSAKSVFYEEFNDIDIYIEDTAQGYDKIFEEIFSRVFHDTYKISKVFPLGSRETVIKEHSKANNKFNRPTLYIVDGDLPLIHDEKALKPGLYSLPLYCIENILIDKESIHKILNEEDPTTLRSKLIELFDFDEWESKNIPHLVDLFIDYGICSKEHPEFQTVAYEIKNLVSSNSGTVDNTKLSARKEQVINAIKERICAEKYAEQRNKIEARILNNNPIVYISGKDYLMPLLLMRLRKVTNTKTPNLHIKSRLAMICNIDSIMDSINYVGQPT